MGVRPWMGKEQLAGLSPESWPLVPRARALIIYYIKAVSLVSLFLVSGLRYGFAFRFGSALRSSSVFRSGQASFKILSGGVRAQRRQHGSRDGFLANYIQINTKLKTTKQRARTYTS